ncbi:GntR family transcriptional regulator [Fodinibius sediminis]|uniref:GntR family transcriptional regulator n=1 Tax=Fodinibius sediminis TaxID=1214077 RepID=A0A521C8D9_9BACT|nr:GntR family transcriptional regulator [Fodinibius sediminis]SMO55071.1 GntR family transcriptional regulator [Fodinibius sediminis]
MELKEGIPLHKQISDWLKDRIESGTLKQDEKLPSENELSQKFDVSRVTIRRALQTLENEDLIYRCQGLGSFVTDQRSHHSFSILNDFSEELSDTSMTASSKLLSFTQKELTDRNDILSYLDMQNKTHAVEIERIRLGDNQPIAYDITWMPIFYGQLIEGFDLEQYTIFHILEKEFEIPIERGCYRVEATLADEVIAGHLEVEPDTPLLLINRISYTIGDKPVYFQQRYYRNDKIVFELMADRRANPTSGEGNIPLKEFAPVFKKEME